MNVEVAQVGLCLQCHYSLQGLKSNRCPECGRDFDPGDPRTMNMGLPIPRRLRVLFQPMGAPTQILAALLILIAWWVLSSPGAYYLYFEYFLLAILFLPFLLIRGAWDFLRIAVAERYQQPAPRFALLTWRGCWVLVAMLAMTISVYSAVPVRLGFALSRSAFEKLARETSNAEYSWNTTNTYPSSSVNVSAGIHTIKTIRSYKHLNQLYFEVSPDAGFIYVKSGALPRAPGVAPDDWGYLGEGWYWVAQE